MFGKRWCFTIIIIYFFQWLEIFECWCVARTYSQNRPAGKADQICPTYHYQGQTCFGRSEKKSLYIIFSSENYTVGVPLCKIKDQRVWQLKPVIFFCRVSSTNWSWKLGSVPWKWDRCNNTKFQIDSFFFSDLCLRAHRKIKGNKKKKAC